ncbi:Fur family transcriptional regulator [Flammeovirga sp. SJP92]|uniref:Fur family transcriptional regulator n=1 Tax=Flammeovirga sp. SJP92 TaxID=1775430 RepID=UPI0007894144|nr:Fur family transcriptional regulator [Flammeovirga sp. SJP92]KXX69956.1 hypothetical protein AVL50_13855 [Flammeovirga sp. SJP92]
MKNEQNIFDLLSSYGIRKTNFRIELLRLFLQKGHGLSHKDIKEEIQCMPDKVTIYRALDTFLEKGIIHRVPDINNVSKYALTNTTSTQSQHNHAHFICKECKKTFCMSEIQIPEVRSKNGFAIESTKLVLEGICPNCNSN